MQLRLGGCQAWVGEWVGVGECVVSYYTRRTPYGRRVVHAARCSVGGRTTVGRDRKPPDPRPRELCCGREKKQVKTKCRFHAAGRCNTKRKNKKRKKKSCWFEFPSGYLSSPHSTLASLSLLAPVPPALQTAISTLAKLPGCSTPFVWQMRPPVHIPRSNPLRT